MSFQDFGFVQWWKAIAIILTGAFGLLALTRENTNKTTGKITKWGWIAALGIVISSVGGLLAQVKESSDQATLERQRHVEILSMLNSQLRALHPLNVREIYGEFRVPCERGYARFCQHVLEFFKANPSGFAPASLYSDFPGGQDARILLALRFFSNEEEVRTQMMVQDDRGSNYSIYQQIPLIAGNDMACGMRVRIVHPSNEVRLFIVKDCKFDATNNFGGLQSHLDLNGLKLVARAAPSASGPQLLEPIYVKFVYADAMSDLAHSFRLVYGSGEPQYVTTFVSDEAQRLHLNQLR